MLAMDVNDNAYGLFHCGALETIASKPAPTMDCVEAENEVILKTPQKKPRDRMRRRAKKLVGCDQPKELYNVLLAGDRLWLPTATQGLVDRDDAAIQIDADYAAKNRLRAGTTATVTVMETRNHQSTP